MHKIFIILILCLLSSLSAEILIPMDNTQTDHLKAYGIAFFSLAQNLEIQWLLNYRGGSWLIPNNAAITQLCNVRGVSYEQVSPAAIADIVATIDQANMEIIKLESEPKIAVYTPSTSEPWDDAVTLALTYAEIEYKTIWDEEVLRGDIADYDWLHLHHEDFSGQYGKFYGSFRNAPWYKEKVRSSEALAAKLGYQKVWQLKHAVAEKIRAFVIDGGFLFAMCAATDTFDIALASQATDIVMAELDGDPHDKNYLKKLDYQRCFAFTDFTLTPSPYVYEFSSIDATNVAKLRGAQADYFTLFDFSAKYDSVPTMLTQNHTNVINGFLGQTTAFHKRYVKKNVVIMGEAPGTDEIKYLHGNMGKGTFTFYGGHDPEDYQHRVGDPVTVLDLHKHSPGYRLILNNVLFPAAEKKKLKT